MIRVSALKWVPPFAQGQVRDLRVRWALEEAGLPYEQMLVDAHDQASKSYRAMQPFGQVPIFEEDGLVLFETGAIVLHIARRSDVLMPADERGRARTTTWMFAALNSIEPFIGNVVDIDLFYPDETWAQAWRPTAAAAAEKRLRELSDWLEGRDYLEDRFTAADLMLATVLHIPRHCDLVAQFSVLDAYKLRCEARPAFKKAHADQMAVFEAHTPEDQNPAK